MSQRRRGRLLKKAEREELIELLEKGVSRTAACRKLGVSYNSFLRTQEDSAAFREAVARAVATIDDNVEMALYRAAVEGSVTAQTFWLKQRRPQGWAEPHHDDSEDDELAKLSDEELLERARAAGIEITPEIARRLGAAYRAGRSGDLPKPRAD